MHRRAILLSAATVLVAGLGMWRATAAEEVKKAPDVAGKWSGTWGVYNPADQGKENAKPSPYQRAQLKLDCNVELKDGKWQATFEGECGRPYKYTIKMLGRQAGSAVLFQGTADLGPEDGGVYDWIGKATDKEFVGFYTSQKYTGTFQLTRPKPAN